MFLEKFTFEGRIRHPQDYCVTRFRSSGHLRTDLLLQKCRFDVLTELLLNAGNELAG